MTKLKTTILPIAALLLVCVSRNDVYGAFSSFQQKNFHRQLSVALHMTLEEERAAALSEYLAKAHEEKLKAIKAVEEKNAEEIMELKAQIEELKSSSRSSLTVSVAPGAKLEDLSKDELIAKVYQFQRFMQDYIVKAQEQKVQAVKAAEADAFKKFLARQEQILTPSAVGSNFIATSTSQTSADLTARTAGSALYEARSRKVKDAAAAGKSRWGDGEVKKVGGVPRLIKSVPSIEQSMFSLTRINGADVQVASEPLSSSSPPPPEVIAADHGLRADGGVGGLTLAQRVALGSKANAADPISTSSTPVATAPTRFASAMSPLYQQRVSKELAAAASGKARWGEKEIQKMQNLGSSLSAIELSSSAVPSLSAIPSSILYQQRVAKVLASASARKSRWGDSEIEKLKHFVLGNSLSSVSSAATSSTQPIMPSTSSTVTSSLYQQRVQNVLKASSAGKSRWGAKEIKKIRNVGFSATATSQSIVVPPEVIAADHGLRADGGVGGLTLAERVALGAKANGAVTPASTSAMLPETFAPLLSPLYKQRNIQVLSAANAGRARWGPKEIARIKRIVEEAGATGVSATKTVNIGAALLGR